MRAIKIVAASVLFSLALLALLVAGALLYAWVDKVDTFFVRNTELENRSYLDTFNVRGSRQSEYDHLIVYANRMEAGSGTIFGYRHYSNANLSLIDDETYEKITVWLPSTPPAATVDIPLDDEHFAFAIYTEGGSAWPREGCGGRIARGVIRIEPRFGGYRVHIQGKKTPASGRAGDCASEYIARVFYAKEIAFERLTPWLGKRGQHPYDETYR